MKTIRAFFIAALALLLAPALHAAPISWSTSTVSGPADVSTAGTLVSAFDVGGAPGTTTINGVVFPGGSTPAAFTIATFTDGYDDFVVESAFGGSTAYRQALETAWFSNPGAPATTVTLNSLTVGRTYEVQMWIVDTRGGGLADRVRSVKGGEATATNTTGGGPNIARGVFVADAVSQAITISSADGPQLNLLQLRDVTGDDVVRNISNSPSAVEELGSPGVSGAHAFTIGAQAVRLSAITVRLRDAVSGPGSSVARVRLWSGSGNVPATLIEDLGTVAVFSETAASIGFPSAARPVLHADTRYWVSVQNVSGDLDWFVTINPASTGTGTLNANQAISSNGGTNWSVFTPSNADERHLFTVQGIPAIVVTNTANSGPGSLRQAMADAAELPGADTITFAPGLSGQTIALSSFSNPGGAGNTALVVNDSGGVTLDASALPAGLTISDGSATTFRLFLVQSGSTLALTGLTLKDGGGAGFGDFGGAISNDGTLTLTRCTLTGCSAGSGGGAIVNFATLALTHCTLSGNTSDSPGGAILNDGTLALTHCTLSGNTASAGGGVIVTSERTLTLTNTLIAGNTATFGAGNGPDIRNVGTVTRQGVNIVQFLDGAAATGPGNILAVAAPLAPLGNYGGPTPTMPPLPGSPALDAATGSTITADQRGLSIKDGDGNGIALPDIGAAEAQRIVVTTTADENDTPAGAQLSLREALRDDANGTTPADLIAFAPALAGLAVAVNADLTVAGIPLDTGTGNPVDVAVNAGTLSFQGGSAWTGGGKILLGATSGSAAATVEVNGPHNFTLAAPITVRPGSSGQKNLRAANVGMAGFNANYFSGAITLLADATVEKVDGGLSTGETVLFTGAVDLGAQQLTVVANEQVYFNGRVFRGDGIGTARLVQNGNNALYLLGSADNTRLAVTVNAGSLFLSKLSSLSVHALGGGLGTADGPALTVAAGATVNVGSGGSGGDQIADTASVTVQGTMDLFASETLHALNGSGTVRAIDSSTLTLGAGNSSGSFTGSLNGSLSLTKTGTGTQTVAGGTMQGALLVSGGTLNVTGSLPNIASATVQSGATLAGPGTVVNLTLESGSFLSPGDPASIGTLTVANRAVSTEPGNLTWHGGATARFHLSGTGATSDQVALAAQLIKGSAGSYTFDFQNTGLPGQTYTLATFASSSGFGAGDFTASNSLPGTFTLNPTSLTFTTYSTIIANGNDSGPGSLRQAVLDAAALPGADTLTFAPGFTGPITLASEIILTSSLTLDGGSSGLTLDGGPGTNRIFTVNSGQTVVLKNLTLTGGDGIGSVYNNTAVGGAVLNRGSLTLERCTLTANSADYGGAVFNDNFATLLLRQCTLSGNGGADKLEAGALYNRGTATLTHCSVAGNTAMSFGGIYNDASQTLTLENTLIGGNTGTQGADIYNRGTLNRAGANLSQTAIVHNSGGFASGSGTVSIAAPLLAPLENYGGSTKTRALLPTSPARNAATAGATGDQRGFPIVGTPDIGAYEAGTFNSYTTYIWETLPTPGDGTLTDPQHAPTHDFDGDGQTNEAEWLALTSAAEGSSRFTVAISPITGGNLPYSFTSALGRNYTVEFSTDLTAPWQIVPGTITGTGGIINAAIGPVTSFPRYFIRVKAALP